MPELPEVETTKRGIAPYVEGRRVEAVQVRESRLRWPVSPQLAQQMPGQLIQQVRRRGKYLLFDTASGCMLLHLGMSGSVRVLLEPRPPEKHEHVDIAMAGGILLRYKDPRRFGSLHWLTTDPLQHPLLASLGPEPLAAEFDGDYLYRHSRGRKIAVKNFLMNAQIVVGVGNIYANEALYHAGIAPGRAAGAVGLQRYRRLAAAVKDVLQAAIEVGGTTLRDFTAAEGEPGYFSQQLYVYGRGGEPCLNCGALVQTSRLGQRATYHCRRCQR